MLLTIYAATKNINKIKEIGNILCRYRVVSAYDLVGAGVNIIESGATFEDNARLKAAAISSMIPGMVIADDSGLEVSSLGGRPGIHSSRFAGENASDEDNMIKLLKELEGMRGYQRKAKFICVIALAEHGKILQLFRGEYEGNIGYVPKGEKGFGYDPLFAIHNGKTFAELSRKEKNCMSHRFKALEMLKSYLNKNIV